MKPTAREWMGWMALAGAATVASLPAAAIGTLGIPYYLTAEPMRPDHWLHPWYRAGGGAGLLTGVLGTAMLVAVLLYSLRKWLLPERLGDIAQWMRLHILCGLLGPVYIILHGGFVMPSGFVAIGFWCLIVITVSGLFGMWIFPLLPSAVQRAKAALESENAVLSALRAKLREADRAHVGRLREAIDLVQSLQAPSVSPLRLLRLDMEIARRKALLGHHLRSAGLCPRLRAETERVLTGQLALRRRAAALEVVQRLLAPWPMLHWPLSLAMYVVAFFHILSALVFGDVLGTLTG